MRILICTGIYPPDIGGPATQAKILFEELPKHQCKVKIVTYGNVAERRLSPDRVLYVNRNQNIFFRYAQYFWKVFKMSKDADIVYAFDLMSVGLPCALVKILRPNIKMFIRLGGDYQWEKAAQARGCACTLEQYYAGKKFSFSEKIIYKITDFVMGRANGTVFNAHILKDIYVKYRKINESKTYVINNIKPEIKIETKPIERDYINILFAGRVIAARNLKNLIDAFISVDKGAFPKRVILEILGDGPEKPFLEKHANQNGKSDEVKFLPGLNHKELLEKIYNSDIVAVVSLTEINSNFMMESLSLGKPVIITSESEPCYVGYKNALIYYANPFNTLDIAEKIKATLNDLVGGRIKPPAITTGSDSEPGIYSDVDQNIKLHLKIFNA